MAEVTGRVYPRPWLAIGAEMLIEVGIEEAVWKCIFTSFRRGWCKLMFALV